ncbi:MAG: helix-turn-helix domain-containing protein [Anaerovoracaceae bacterium]
MDFGSQIKSIRKEQNLTQEQLASKLNVTRQAVSNWENNKSLPDLGLVIDLADIFGISLDRLILGDRGENNLTEKLIHDGSEVRRAKFSMISCGIGAMLLLHGISCIILKAVTVSYIDTNGILHENFFFLPIGFLLIFFGLVTFSAVGINNILSLCLNKSSELRHVKINTSIVCGGIVSLFFGALLLLMYSNGGYRTMYPGLLFFFAGAGLLIFMFVKGLISVFLKVKRLLKKQ